MQNRILMLLAVAALTTACSKPAQNAADTGMAAQGVVTPPADQSAEAAAIVKADSAWMRHVQSRNVDSVMSWYTPDAVSYGFGGSPASGTDQIRANYTEFVKATITEPKILTNTVKFSDDGNMAYDHGTYTMTVAQPGGKPARENGAYLNVWRKVDGQWKLVAEMGTPVAAPKQ
jgi:uncharacterized protein (TIGR02246 family)